MATSDEEFDINKLAVALKYNQAKDDAPRLSAKGKGHLADQIIALAKEHNIEIRKDEDLALLLSKLDIDAPIPLEAYAAVAEILSYVYKANDKMKDKR
ncbi:MAG: EscU/YscU/HrcU family type III secretion system export apparatus switch protein [Rickettsiales bacterium]